MKVEDAAKTHYEVLDLDRDASQEEIHAAYRRLARDCHPDVAGEDEKAAATFRRLTEADRTLSDPDRKRAYDRTLPQKSYPLRHPTPQKIWREATEVVLMRSDRFGPLNEAMQIATPIAWAKQSDLQEHEPAENDLLVVGLAGHDYRLHGHMESAANRNAVRNALELVVGRRQEFEVILGTTKDDFDQWAGSRQPRPPNGPGTEPRPKREREVPAATVWETLVHRIHSSFQNLPQRQYPQVRARFVHEVIGWILQTEDQLRSLGEPSNDATERALARVIERVGAVVDLPPTQVALELQRVRRVLE